MQGDLLGLLGGPAVDVDGVAQHGQHERHDGDDAPRGVRQHLQAPQRVGGDDDRRGQRPHEAQVARGVLLDDAAHGLARELTAARLAVALAGGHEQGAERGGQQEPARERDARRGAAREHAQQEAGGDARELDDRLVLHAEAVGQLDREVDGQDDRQRGLPQRPGDEGHDGEDDRQRDRPTDAQLPRRDGPEPLARVRPVGLDVARVVDQVDRAGDQAEQDERDPGADEGGAADLLARGQHGGQDEDVLDPLPRAHGAQPRGARGRRAGVGGADEGGHQRTPRRVAVRRATTAVAAPSSAPAVTSLG